jgi:hypothetical protein
MLGEEPGRLLPARLDRVASDSQYALDPLEYRDAIVQPFAGHERSGLLTTPVWRYLRVKLDDSSSAQIALAFTNGDPAIVRESLYGGSVILLATAVSPASVDRSTTPPTPWTALPTWPSFPPLIQEILAVSVQGRTANRNLRVGEPLEGSVQGTYENVNVLVQRPDGSEERVPMRVVGSDSRWVYPAVDLSGMYGAEYGSPIDRQNWFAVNVDPQESNLQRIDPELLPNQIRLGVQMDQPEASLSLVKPTEYYRHLLGLLFVLLLVESGLAWYFGNASV